MREPRAGRRAFCREGGAWSKELQPELRASWGRVSLGRVIVFRWLAGDRVGSANTE